LADIYNFNQEKNKRSDEYERCVICNKLTDVKVSTPVENRPHYVEGIGQLCRKCFLEIKS
jgi:hypothetical protein